MIRRPTVWQTVVDSYYPAASPLRDVYMRHCSSVAALALDIARSKYLNLPDTLVVDAAMLHDIGIFLTNAPSIQCRGTQPYICHGYLGADLLRANGIEEELARVAERHTGAGLTKEEIIAQHLPLPADRSYMPETLLEQLICYADKFYSKSGDMQRKTVEQVRASLARHNREAAERFDILHKMFSSED